jgi:hypothetical protein
MEGCKDPADCTFSAGLTVFTSGKAALTLRFVKAIVLPIFMGRSWLRAVCSCSSRMRGLAAMITKTYDSRDCREECGFWSNVVVAKRLATTPTSTMYCLPADLWTLGITPSWIVAVREHDMLLTPVLIGKLAFFKRRRCRNRARAYARARAARLPCLRPHGYHATKEDDRLRSSC